MKWYHFFVFVLYVGLLMACQSEEPIAELVVTRVGNVTTTPLVTTVAITSTAVFTPTPIPQPTSPPTMTPAPSKTAVLLPLPTMSPFPTVTPRGERSERRPVFLMYAATRGDGGGDDVSMGEELPIYVIFGDGYMLRRRGQRGGYRLEETYLTAADMCDLRQQIAATGFLEPYNDYYTQHENSDGAPSLLVQLEEHWLSFYTPNLPYLIDEMAAGLEIVQTFSPNVPFTTYVPEEMYIWIDEVVPNETTAVASWPAQLPPLDELWLDQSFGGLSVPSEYITSLYAWFDNSISQRVIVEDDTYYRLISSPRTPIVEQRRPIDYVSTLSCEDEPMLISPDVPTVTPTPAPETAGLRGIGRIAFTAATYSTNRINVMDANGTNRVQLTNRNGDAPAWSPDGRHIAFVAFADGADQIYVMNADGTDVVQLTAYEYDSYSPTWFPDGNQILFVRDKGTWKKTRFYIMNGDGSKLKLMLDNGQRNMTPAIAPDGGRIVYVRRDEDNNTQALYLLDITQEPVVETEIVTTVERPFSPIWSPDGERIAYTYPIGSRRVSGIVIIEPDGTVEATYELPLGVIRSLSWSANGAYFIFSAYDEGRRDIFALDLATEDIIQLTHTEQDESAPALWP